MAVTWKLTLDSLAAIVTAPGTVSWLGLALTRVTVRGAAKLSLRVTVARIVCPSWACWLEKLKERKGIVSLSRMLRTAEVIDPRVAPPPGLVRLRLIVSVGSGMLSSVMGMEMFLLASPSAKFTVIGVFT